MHVIECLFILDAEKAPVSLTVHTRQYTLVMTTIDCSVGSLLTNWKQYYRIIEIMNNDTVDRHLYCSCDIHALNY